MPDKTHVDVSKCQKGPWKAENNIGAGVEIYAKLTSSPGPSYQVDPDKWYLMFAAGWVQFRTEGWVQMQLAHAKLFAEAANVASETGHSPRELLDTLKMLIEWGERHGLQASPVIHDKARKATGWKEGD